MVPVEVANLGNAGNHPSAGPVFGVVANLRWVSEWAFLHLEEVLLVVVGSGEVHPPNSPYSRSVKSPGSCTLPLF